MKNRGSANRVIRSITLGLSPQNIQIPKYQLDVKNAAQSLVKEFSRLNISVRTLRITSPFLNRYISFGSDYDFKRILQGMEAVADAVGARWFNVPINLVGLDDKDLRRVTRLAYQTLKNHPRAFVHLAVASNTEISPLAAVTASKLIRDVSVLSFNGFDNFRLGVSSNPADDTPFFPFAYASNENSFSIAVESTPHVLFAARKYSYDLNHARDAAIESLGHFAVDIQTAALESDANNYLSYKGQDLSLSPYPEEKISVLEVLEALGGGPFGAPGSLYMTSIMTEIVKTTLSRFSIVSSGFNGVMYSLLEDHKMSEANDSKRFSFNDILTYSTLCGCGLDMIPIPGDFLVEEVASALMDMSAIAIRLNKPLGLRLLPIPNGYANDYTNFFNDFFTDTRILALRNSNMPRSFFENQNFKYL